MIQATPAMQILGAVQPAHFRRGIDGLAAFCRQHPEDDPMSGCAFVVRNRRGPPITIAPRPSGTSPPVWVRLRVFGPKKCLTNPRR